MLARRVLILSVLGGAALIVVTCSQNNLLVKNSSSSQQMNANDQQTLSKAAATPLVQDRTNNRNGQIAQSDEQGDSATTVSIHKGKYDNYEYGYSVVIPEGLQGISSPPPMPQHGFYIDLFATGVSDNPRITVFAMYNIFSWSSLDDAVKASIDSFKKDKIEFVILEQSLTKLDNVPAVRLVTRHEDLKSGESVIAAEIMALRKDRSGTEVVYQLILRASDSRYDECKIVLEQIRRSWKSIPLQ
ncbi:MAG: hypothetical protein ICV60_03690 [Pyrinomonadaceae bacterium]|nr:hypothetical protein [Pyrinomonadaceae bacterium]